jgi:phosphoglycerate dehydrogenase-like enzyme
LETTLKPNPDPRRPLTLLLSKQAAHDFGARIEQVLCEVPYRFIHLESEPDAGGDFGADIAFLTREVTGKSGKTQLTDSLLRFYEILRGSPRLQWVHAHSAGADRPIYPELRKRNVVVTTSSGANAEPVAQMAVTGLLMLGRRMPELMDAQRRKSWEPLLGARAPNDLRNQTALVVGLGSIGQEIARLLKALGMHVIGVRRSRVPCPPCDETVAFEDLPLVLPRADWAILACPLTGQTRGLLNAASIALLPGGARVVNVARGEVAVESDLIAALGSGHLGGAYLDVFESEPLSPESPLWSLPNVIVTPHTAGHTTGHYGAVGEIFLDNLARWRDGRAMRNEVV